jgi:hypothetical protein
MNAARFNTGVLTKRDRIPAGDEHSWLSLIPNEKESLENNWYCVKQPGPNDLKQGITWSEARKREDEFFSMTQPWNELDGIYQKYLRTRKFHVVRFNFEAVGFKRHSTLNIRDDLIVYDSLSEIQEELDKSIFNARTELSALPKEPSKDPRNEISNLLHGFVTKTCQTTWRACLMKTDSSKPSVQHRRNSGRQYDGRRLSFGRLRRSVRKAGLSEAQCF